MSDKSASVCKDLKCKLYTYEPQSQPLLSCNVKVRALVLLTPEPLQDPRMRTDHQRAPQYVHLDNLPGYFTILYKLKIVSYLGIIFGLTEITRINYIAF